MTYLILTLIILTSGSVIGIEYKNTLNILLIILLAFEILNFKFNFTKYSKKISFFILIFSLYIVLNTYNSLEDGFNNMSLLFFLLTKIIFLSLYIIMLIKRNKNIIHILSYIILYLSIVSFTVYLLVFFNFPIPLVNKDHIPTYIYIMKDFGNDFGAASFIRRNAGIFFEPGLYQIYLNFALIYFLNKKVFVISIFLLLNVLLTYSPIGYLLSFCIVFFYFFKLRLKNILISIILLILLIMLILNLNEFITVKQNGMSYYLRYQDINLGIKLFIDKPIIGWGIGNDLVVQSFFYQDVHIRRGLSNGLASLLYQSGIIGFIFYITGFIKFIKVEYIKKKYYIYISFFIFSLLNENIYLNNFFLLIIIYGYVRSKNEKNIIYRT